MADETHPEESKRSFYLEQIKHLDEELKWRDQECIELEKQNKDLISLCDHLVVDKNDIVEYLEYATAAEDEKIAEETELLENELLASEQEKETLKLQNSQKKQELQECIDDLISVNKTLEETCNEQEMQLAELVNKEEQLVEQLKNQKHKFVTVLAKLLKDTQIETQKMIEEIKQTFHAKVSNIVQKEKALYKDVLKQLDSALIEQSNLQCHFQYMRVTVQSLCSLIIVVQSLKNNLACNMISKSNSEHRSCLHQGENQLKTKCKELEKCKQNFCMKQQRLQAEKERLREEIAAVSEMCCQKTAKAGQAKAELQMETSRRRQLESLMKEAIIILRHVVAGPMAVDDIPGEMHRLLKVLESGTAQGSSVPQRQALTHDVSTEKSTADSPSSTYCSITAA
ncbi:uncharacterized protein V6R79_000024 [Siganus canaliculatus]